MPAQQDVALAVFAGFFLGSGTGSSRPEITGSNGSQTGTAGFLGNFTAIQEPSQGAFLIAREPDCSLGLVATDNSTDPATSTQHYEQVLHQLASLTTTPDVFPKGCAETSTGISSRPGVFVGGTTNQVLVFAAAGANGANNAVFRYTVSSSGVAETTDTSVPAATALAAGDLNGDGNNDLVIVNGYNAASAFVSVELGNADGSFQSHVDYATAGSSSAAAVLADVNGDGKLDIVVLSAVDPAGINPQQISVLLGNGNGTFQSAQSFNVPVLPGVTGTAREPVINLIAADVNGDGKQDLIASNGLVFLGNGDGTFTPSATPAFPYVQSPSSEGPNLAAGDVNNDGKVDLVVSNGLVVSIWLGKGDGTFTQGLSYAAVNDTGFVTITDLDGDGNADIYVGLADKGLYGGDDSNQTLGYVLMGNGDGTFRGAPLAPGAYSGNNLLDINGDGIPDLVSNANGLYGSTGSPGFAVALGTGMGTFTVHSTVTAPDTFVLNGFTFTGVASAGASSYAVGDVNGDGKPDLVFVDNNLTAKNPGGFLVQYPYPIYFVALGNGDGTFQTPVPYAFPQIAPASGFDNSLTVGSLQIADFNKDGHADLIFTYNDLAGGSIPDVYLQGFVVLAGAGNGTFSTTAILTSTYSSNTAPATALTDQITNVVDLNQDGTPDLVVSVPSFSISTGATTAINVFVGNGDGTFKTPAPVNIAANAYGIPVIADFNNDGKLDIAFVAETSSSQAELAIALGNGDGTFAAPVTSNLSGGDAIQSAGLAAADFDADGKVDLALIDNNDFSGIFYGNGDGTFTSVPLNGNIIPKDLLNLAAGAPAVAADLNHDGKPDILAGNVVLISSSVPVVVVPSLSASPQSLFFGTQLVATPSTASAVTIANSGGAALLINSIAIAGANSGDFGVSHNCPIAPNSLATGNSCMLQATFTPQAAGPRKSSISISDNAGSGAQTIILTGVGAAIGTAPSSLSFGSQQVGVASASMPVTIANAGNSAVSLYQITFIGANAGDFSKSKTSTCASSLGAAADCTINVVFTPGASGSRTASMVISDSGGGSPQAVPVSGTGTSGAIVPKRRLRLGERLAKE